MFSWYKGTYRPSDEELSKIINRAMEVKYSIPHVRMVRMVTMRMIVREIFKWIGEHNDMLTDASPTAAQEFADLLKQAMLTPMCRDNL